MEGNFQVTQVKLENLKAVILELIKQAQDQQQQQQQEQPQQFPPPTKKNKTHYRDSKNISKI